MRLFVGGLRGSQPCCGAQFQKYGGDTTCLLVTGGHGELLILDAGSGIRGVAEELSQMTPGHVTILFTHYHLDHMIGLTMNPLFYQRPWFFEFIGPTFAKRTVHEAVAGVMGPPYWPLSYGEMEAKFSFSPWDKAGRSFGSLNVRSCPVSHPGGCLAYRIDDTEIGTSLVFATDMEWQKQTDRGKEAFLNFCRDPKPAQLLIIDAHFTRAQLPAFEGWGHNCWEDCLEIAKQTGVERVLLGHHAPESDDETLQDQETHVKRQQSNAAFAQAGHWILL